MKCSQLFTEMKLFLIHVSSNAANNAEKDEKSLKVIQKVGSYWLFKIQ
jgi:hypothetical protein